MGAANVGPDRAGLATSPSLDLWVVDRNGTFHGDDGGPEPALAALLQPLVERVFAAGARETIDLQLPVEGAQPRVLRAFARPLGEGTLALAVLDLSGLRDVEESLSRYDLVLRATHDAVWEWNVVTNEAWWNPRQFALLDYDPATTRPSYEAWAARIHPEDRGRVAGAFERAMASPSPTWQDEFRTLRADGSITHALDRGYVERDSSGRPIRVIGVMSDVTEQRAAVAALRESEERFRQLTTAIDEVFWMTTLDASEILYVSPSYEKIWGKSRESLYANPSSFLDAILEEDRPRVNDRLPRQARGDYDETYRIRRPDGRIAWIRDRAFPIRDEHGKIVRFAGVAEDITVERTLEEQLSQSQKMESIGRLAGGIAHDFNNLLTVMLASTSFALGRVEDRQAKEDLLQIKEAAERAGRLTGQLLAFARRQVIRPVRLDLNALASEMEGLLRRVLGETVELTTMLASNLGTVVADRGQLEQVVLNLAINARDAMPKGGRLTLETANVTTDGAYSTLHPEVVAGEYVMLAVSDTGIGMTPEIIAHLFEPFFTTKPAGQGTGLGLATSYGIVRQADGHILVYSEPGRGTTFKILIPRVNIATEAAEALREGELKGGTETILFVEDDAAVRNIGVRILSKQGYRVLAAAGGLEALQLSKQTPGPIHLLISDVVMPRMNGVELASRLRVERPELRVLFTSGYPKAVVSQDDVLEADASFLPKPYVVATLLSKVREVLDQEG